MTVDDVSRNILYVIEAVTDDYRFYFDFINFDGDSLLKNFQRYVRFFELKDSFQKNPPLVIALDPNSWIRYFRIDFDNQYFITVKEVTAASDEVKAQELRSQDSTLNAYSELSSGACYQQLLKMKHQSGAFYFPEDFNIILHRPIETTEATDSGKDI